jgi:nucleoside-diphosphate-sugar epimerase
LNIFSYSEDFHRIFDKTAFIWDDLRGMRLFLTGGTGFFGRWLLESLVWANEHYDLNASVLVLTRNSESFEKSAPEIASNPSISFHKGDIRLFDFPEGKFTHIIHGATTAAEETFLGQDPLLKFDTVAQGTRRVLDFAVQCGVKKFLHLSSGSAYGKQPSDMIHIPESYPGAPLTTDNNFDHSALGEGKRAAELLCTIYSAKYGIETKIARCFSFVGPGLPLDIHYAIGNFIRDGLKRREIRVNGDGSQFRSYLYAADLVLWLWTILINGKSSRIYNVGSDESVTIKELAYLVASCFEPTSKVVITKFQKIKTPENRYVPSINRVRMELGLEVYTPLHDSIIKTIFFYKKLRPTV